MTALKPTSEMSDGEAALELAGRVWPESLWYTVSSKSFAIRDDLREPGQLRIDDRGIDPIWQRHGQSVIEWKLKSIREIGNYSCCAPSELCRWLREIATATPRRKADEINEFGRANPDYDWK